MCKFAENSLTIMHFRDTLGCVVIYINIKEADKMMNTYFFSAKAYEAVSVSAQKF